MHMISIRRAFAGITTGLALLMAINAPADAAPHHQTPATTGICATGFRGQPAYDRLCLTRGDYSDARREWVSGYSKRERAAQCRTALKTGMPTLVRETRGDVIHDTYRNNRAMIQLTAWAGAAECFRIG